MATACPYIVTLAIAEQFTGADAAHGLVEIDNAGPMLRAKICEIAWRSGGGTVGGDTVALVRVEMFNPVGAATEVVEVKRWENEAEAIVTCQFTLPPGWQVRFFSPVLVAAMTVVIDYDDGSLIGGAP